MGQVLHGCATTTEAIRRAIQGSQESLRSLSRRHGINSKTVAKWRRRASTSDCPTGPKQPKSTVLSIEEEAVVVAFRKQTLLPLDDCLYALQPTIPHLTRSSLHRCLQRHGISRLPQAEGDKPSHKRFKSYPIGYFHIDIAEVRTAEGKLHLFVAIDRTSKFAFVRLEESATVGDGHGVSAIADRRAALPDPHRAHRQRHPVRRSALAQERSDGQGCACTCSTASCAANNIEHRATKPNHPWTNGQVERMNRTIKEATVKRYHYDRHDQLRQHLHDFIDAYNFARRLKALGGLTPYEYCCKCWTSEPGSIHHRSAPSNAGTKHLGIIS